LAQFLDRGQRTLTFEERVSYQRAIEEVYWRHRVWPKENSNPKPSLDAVMSQAQLEKKVADYLRKSQAFEDYWQRPITAEQLQAEIDRMIKHTKQPAVLCELFQALGNDPFVIAESLARPTLIERMLIDSSGKQIGKTTGMPTAKYTLPALASLNIGGEYDPTTDTWVMTGGAPSARASHSAVWTGTEMIVWGGGDDSAILNTGARYNPSTDSWTATSTTNAPRSGQTAVWTGSEMIVWSGFVGDSPGRYNPATDNWTPISLSKAPSDRLFYTAVWSGSEMIIWGGREPHVAGKVLNTGGRYNPASNTWTATSTVNVPGHEFHTAVWTGSEMVIWGGDDESFNRTNTGGRYNSATDSWTATSTTNAPAARLAHTAVWTGSEMIIWGGLGPGYLSTNGKYNPETDSWTLISTTNAPSLRDTHTAIWTGSEMIIWGGVFVDSEEHYLNTGGKYNPSTDSWTITNTTSAPDGRINHTAVWSGNEMIIWGGYFSEDEEGNYLDTGGRYNPNTDTWSPTQGAPDATTDRTAVWTGSEMIIWGGGSNTGARYNPATDHWTATSTINAPSARSLHTALWTGTEMVIWGGWDGAGDDFNTGGKYNPTADVWTGTTTTNAPVARSLHTAVWTGAEMIVWGGIAGVHSLNTGGRYNPDTDTWTPSSTVDAPDGRTFHTAVWTGSEMIVWGGALEGFDITSTGGRYELSTDSWSATTMLNAPDPRYDHTAVWTGSEMIVWGGQLICPPCYSIAGWRYNPNTDGWTATSVNNAPDGRAGHTAVWTGDEMIVWGGFNSNLGYLDTGSRYDPSADTWIATNIANAPAPRSGHTAVWTGSEMIVWGGSGSTAPSPTPTPTPTVSPSSTPRPRPSPRDRPTPHPRP
jgi:N-acetylneuraminic acid mutarotase